MRTKFPTKNLNILTGFELVNMASYKAVWILIYTHTERILDGEMIKTNYFSYTLTYKEKT